MKNKSNVIPLFGREDKHENDESKIGDVIQNIEPDEVEESEPFKAGIEDWIVETFNGIPVSTDTDGVDHAVVPVVVVEDIIQFLREITEEQCIMMEALTELANRENDIESRIAIRAINKINEINNTLE